MDKIKLLLIFCAITVSTWVSGQPYPVKIGLNVNRFDVNTARIGTGISVKVARFYFDISSNFAKGEGKLLKSRSYDTYKLGKRRVDAINIGYIFPCSNIFIIPKIGIGRGINIYQNDVPKQTYYLWNEKSYLNVGLMAGYNISRKIALQFGFGTFERINAGISYYIGDY